MGSLEMEKRNGKGEDKNGYELYKNEKREYKAWKTTVFVVKYANC